jgi:1,2-dihydroxy-3-keto-5-methylthiopentene dioxygenase
MLRQYSWFLVSGGKEMTALSIYNDDATGEPEHILPFKRIASTLNKLGVQIERWDANKKLSADARQDEVIDAYKESIDRLNQKYQFQSVDVVSLRPDNPKCGEMRNMFLMEHFHRDFEVRFFVDGRGLFYLHIDKKVYCLLCEKNDLISVPANTKHWFDMGLAPDFKAIRLFTTDQGWIADFTGSDISTNFPDFDQYLKLIEA